MKITSNAARLVMILSIIILVILMLVSSVRAAPIVDPCNPQGNSPCAQASTTPVSTHDSNGPDNSNRPPTRTVVAPTEGSPTPSLQVTPTATLPGLRLGQTDVPPGTKGRSTWIWGHPRGRHR